MDEKTLRELLDGVRAGTTSPDAAVAALSRLPWADLGFARVDHHRALRQPVAEAVYAPGKTAEQCGAIVRELLARDGGPVLLTRATGDQIAACPEGNRTGTTVSWRSADPRTETVVVITAGTADLPVADECAATLGAYGFKPTRIADVGVAGVHRLLPEIDTIATADVVIVIAGMEGALASVVGGIARGPVIAVPTSVGYGAAFEGITALLAMHASCAAGITVVGIDNGFGAACAVARICARARGVGGPHGA